MSTLNDAVSFIKSKTHLQPEIGFVLGSGLGAFADQIQEKVVIPFQDIPGFSKSNVVGHAGELIIGRLGEKKVAVLKGRVHFYEGHSPEGVVFPVRTLAKLGIQVLIVTNAAGGLDKKMKPGELMVISDHINLTGQNPLIGKNDESLGTRFPDMSEAYDKKLSQKLFGLLKKLKIRSSRGIYCGVTGPSYETPAEVRYLRKIGGDAVGMSTVLEVIAAKHMGVDVVGLSCITNLAAGILKKPLDHKEVTETAKIVEKNFIKVLKEFTKSL